MNIKVLFDDDQMLVIEKPPGVVVNRADSVKGETIQDWMESKGWLVKESGKEHFREFINRSGVVHRLDKETSGLMVLSKTVDAFVHLKDQFKKRVVEKSYLALVHGVLTPIKGSVRLPMARNILNRRRFCITVDGKMAISNYHRQEVYSGEKEEFSLVAMFPKTGRTHQIRVQLSHLGFPIVSDPLYLGKRLKSDLMWCPRLFLHAWQLSLNHPKTQKRIDFNSSLPEDLSTALSSLTSNN